MSAYYPPTSGNDAIASGNISFSTEDFKEPNNAVPTIAAVKDLLGGYATTAQLNDKVGKSGDETISGVKTFSGDIVLNNDEVNLGTSSNASASDSVAIGKQSTASADQAIAAGSYNTASGQQSVAIGYASTASGYRSVAVGFTSARGNYDTAIVGQTTTGFEYQTALGTGSYSQNDYATSLGAYAEAKHDSSTAIGRGAITSAANQIKLGTSSNNVIVDGDVGIGTDSPEGKLHLSSGTSGDCKLILEADTDNNDENDTGMIVFKQDGGTERAFVGMEDNNLSINTSSAGAIMFKTNNNSGTDYTDAVERMRVQSNGYVGIGTTSPSRELHLHSTGDLATLQLTAGDMGTGINDGLQLLCNNATKDGYLINREDGDLRFYTNNTQKMEIKSSGYVGIGTSSPAKELHIKETATTNSYAVLELEGTRSAGTRRDRQAFIGAGADSGNYGTNFYIRIRGSVDSVVDWDTNSKNVFYASSTSINLYTGDTRRVNIDSTGTLNYYYGINNASDNRIKHNETPITTALPMLRQLQLYNYIKTPNKLYDENHHFTLDASGNPTDAVDVSGNPIQYVFEDGFLAQDVLNISGLEHAVHNAPERGDGEADDTEKPLTLDYNCLYNHGLIAIKELDVELQAEKAKVATLETENETLRTQVEDILARLTALETA